MSSTSRYRRTAITSATLWRPASGPAAVGRSRLPESVDAGHGGDDWAGFPRVIQMRPAPGEGRFPVIGLTPIMPTVTIAAIPLPTAAAISGHVRDRPAGS